MKPETRKVHGWILTILSIVLVVGTTCASMAMDSEKKAILTLSPGETATLSVFRLLPASTPIVLRMSEKSRKEHDRHGNYIPEPDAPTLVQLQTCNDSKTLQIQAKNFKVWNEKTDPRTGRAFHQQLPAGHCKLTFTVLSVDPQSTGQAVQLELPPTITFKRVVPGYGFLWLFAFGWPFFTLILLLYLLVFAVFLAWDTHKQQTREAAAR